MSVTSPGRVMCYRTRDVEIAELRATVAELIARDATRSDELAALTRRIGALEGARSRVARRREGRLLVALAGAVHGRAFTAAEVLAHAALVSPSLQRALTTLGIHTAQQLGKRLQRLCGRARQGLRLQRLGVENSGVVWVVEVVP